MRSPLETLTFGHNYKRVPPKTLEWKGVHRMLGLVVVVFSCDLVLCVIYVVMGRMPYFHNGLVYNTRSGLLVSAGLGVYLAYRTVSRYFEGTGYKRRYALHALWHHKAWVFPFIFAPIALLVVHSLYGLMNHWWGNMIFGVVTLNAAWMFHEELVDFGRERTIVTYELFGVDVDSPGTFLAGSWAIACLARGAGVVGIGAIKSLVQWAAVQ